MPGVLLAAVSLGCSDSGGPEQVPLSILLTDAEGDVLQAVVTIERIELVGQSADQDGPGTVVRDVPFTTDLLTLSNDVATLVEDFPVSAGNYAQLRFIITGACIVVEGEGDSMSTYASAGYDECGASDGPLQMPSFEQTGIKVNLPGGSLDVEGEQKIVLVDFDVSESFGQIAGGSGGWVMTPVLAATELGFTASVAVAVSLAEGVSLPDVDGQPVSLADFEVEATSLGGDPEGSVALTGPDEDGVFEATFLFVDPSGSPYSIGLAHDDIDVTTSPASPVSVPVSSGAESSQSVVVVSAALSPG